MTRTRKQLKRKSTKNKQTKIKQTRRKQTRRRKSDRKRSKQQTRQQKRQDKRRTLRKQRRSNKQTNMKGGAIPFSELGNVLDSAQYMLSKSISPFVDSAVPVANNPRDIVNPDPTKQFIRTQSIAQQTAQPNLPRQFNDAFS